MIRNDVRYNKNSTFDDIKNVLEIFRNKDHKKEFQNIYKSTFKRLMEAIFKKIWKRYKHTNLYVYILNILENNKKY